MKRTEDLPEVEGMKIHSPGPITKTIEEIAKEIHDREEGGGRDTERKVFAVILCLAFVLGAIITLTGCAGINFRHMTVDGIELPDALYTQFRAVAGPLQMATFGTNYHDREIPRVVDVPPNYSRARAQRQVRALALWTIEHGYTCEIWTLRRRGWAAHPVLAVILPAGTVMLDPAMHHMTTKLGRWTVIWKADEDEITHKGILDIGRGLILIKNAQVYGK